MSCTSTYSCPITIPTGSNGAPGPAGADGTDGAAILNNTTGTDYTSSSVGVASLTTYNVTGGTLAIGDILEIESTFYLTAFTGTLQIKFGTATAVISGYDAGASPDVLDPTGTIMVVELKAVVSMKTLAIELIKSSTTLYGNPSTTINKSYATEAENSANAILIDVRVSNTAGTAVCKSFVVKHNKKA